MNKCPNVKTCRRIRTRVNKRTKRNRKITNRVGKITVHQIFGLMGDKILPPLFKKSKEAFVKFCKRNGYKYKFWNKKMCDDLIKEYSSFKNMYDNVRYTIMKVDIIRFIILHKYGGLYSDLDVIPGPKLKKLKQGDFIVARPQTNKSKKYEMEVLQSVKGNPLLLEYLNYVREQIKIKDKKNIYKKWKCRYIYQTTGPYSLSRFLKGKTVDTYIINNPSYEGDKSMNIKGNEDFISHISCSYKDKL
jgi:mannosyltransferase OCH1-like enzyme